MGSVVIDDRLLAAVLLQQEPEGLAQLRRQGRLFTTGLWYHRLCRALAGGRVAGRLSSAVLGAPVEVATAALAAVVRLPAEIGLVSLRELAWPMGRAVTRHRLNLMSLEALCAAERLGATLCVAEANESPTLLAAASDVGVPVARLGVSARLGV